MKIKALSRSASAYQPPGSEVPKAPRNLDPAIHPFERAREYKRALNAVKLERMFAQPFIAQLGRGHVDGVYSLAKDPNSLDRFASGAGDGVVKVWNLTSREEVWKTTAAENTVKGMAWTKDQKLLTVSADKNAKLFDPYNTPSDSAPINTWLGGHALSSISMHRSKNAFAVSSDCISVYDLDRYTAAPEVLRWPKSGETITSVAFNQSETSVLGSTCTDRSITLFDLRTSAALSRTFLDFYCNKLAWNPVEPMNFAVCSEDHNSYMFDMRRMDRALNVFKDHVAAVMDVSFSPTGTELVTASWDRTVRLWDRDQGHSRDVCTYTEVFCCFRPRHGPGNGSRNRKIPALRMRVFATEYTPDSKTVISASDDGNVRLWRAHASNREGVKSARHRQALEYNEALSARYSHMPEIRRIKRHRHIPKVVKKAGEIKKDELKAIKKREENERKHTKKQFEKRKSEREKVVLAREK
ncbi:Uu.00g072780.m01.CDS01 [Anthostomella pinea]|uniref:Uu.00g072780.m01.CDS01 n=1 Tax=Anthostomella pinea TaxID=933095 RepID=A0AAI8VWD0_9PEZI|nr:Uu.00g072780.m01.CDS01 [Anthostomella pinea]